jgi:hypothetical protein
MFLISLGLPKMYLDPSFAVQSSGTAPIVSRSVHTRGLKSVPEAIYAMSRGMLRELLGLDVSP